MKTIRLKQICKKGKAYEINLGNGTSNCFSSQREAVSFLFNTNLFLTQKLHELHKVYCEVWNSYQSNWFYLDNDRKTPKFAIKETERRCVRNFEAISDLFNLSVERCAFPNGNYFVFIHFFKVTEYLEETIRMLAEIFGKHSNTNAICIMDINIKHVSYTRNELTNFGKFSTTKTFKIPTHISENVNYVPDYSLAVVA